MYNNISNVRLSGDIEKTVASRTGDRQSSLIEVLRFIEKSANQILAALPADELARLLPFAENVSFSGGEIVCQPDNIARCVYFPETSVFSQYQILEDGRMCEIAMTGREGFVGLSAVSGARAEKYWTEVSVGGSAVRINRYLFEREFAESNLLRAKILEFVDRYIEQISQRVVCNCHHQIKERFCNWLLMLEDRRGRSCFSLTQEQIARFLGVHRPSLSCVAKELQQRNIIAYSRGQLVILDRNQLEQSACSCYTENRVYF